MAIIPGQSGTSAKAVDGIEGATAGSPVSLPSGFSGPSQRPFAAPDANLTMDVATHGGLVTMTPTAARVVTLPSTSVSTGYSVEVINLSASFSITLQASGGGTVTVVGPTSSVKVYATAGAPTLASQWSISNAGAVAVGGNSLGTDLTLGTNDNFALNFETNGTVRGSVDTAGAWTLGPSGAADGTIIHRVNGRFIPNLDNTYNLGQSDRRWSNVWAGNSAIQTSDERLKKNINPMGGVLEKIMQVVPSTWESKYETYRVGTMGFVAQQLEQVFPELVQTQPDTIEGHENIKTVGVSGQEMAAILVKAIQELKAELDEAKARIQTLEGGN